MKTIQDKYPTTAEQQEDDQFICFHLFFRTYLLCVHCDPSIGRRPHLTRPGYGSWRCRGFCRSTYISVQDSKSRCFEKNIMPSFAQVTVCPHRSRIYIADCSKDWNRPHVFMESGAEI